MTMPAERAALLSKAEKATPGPWALEERYTVIGVPTGPHFIISEHGEILAEVQDDGPPQEAARDAAYIAACSPEFIVALLREYAEMDQDIELIRGLPPNPTEWEVMEERIAALEARNEKLTLLADAGEDLNAAFNPLLALGPAEIHRRRKHWNALLAALAAEPESVKEG